MAQAETLEPLLAFPSLHSTSKPPANPLDSTIRICQNPTTSHGCDRCPASIPGHRNSFLAASASTHGPCCCSPHSQWDPSEFEVRSYVSLLGVFQMPTAKLKAKVLTTAQEALLTWSQLLSDFISY